MSLVASILFALLSLVGAAITYNLYRPLRYRGGLLLGLSFFGGWLGSELALHHLVVQVVVTVVFGLLGAFKHPPGQAGLALTAISWGATLVAYRRGMRTDRAVEAALVEGLGADYRARIRPEAADRFEEGLHWGRIARPFKPHRPEVERVKDIRFARQKGVNLRLDVYRNPAHPEHRPMLLHVHGGGWMIGSKDDQGLPLMNLLASHGWVCVSADYRLSPHATMPEHLVDVKLAIQWMREHGAEFGGDPGFIAITGGSAGGHLSALAALTANAPEFQPGFEEADTRVSACVPFYGAYDLVDDQGVEYDPGLTEFVQRHVMKGTREEVPEVYAQASPIRWISADAPPFFVIHGDSDSLAPLDGARRFVEALRKTSRSAVAFAVLPGAQHGFEVFASARALHAINGVERFLAWAHGLYLEAKKE